MSKELPFFKFFVSEWLQGDITLCSLEAQGLFINICAYYWSNNNNMAYSKIKLRFSQDKATLFNELKNNNIIKVDEKNDVLTINFLNEQIKENTLKHKKLSDSGKAGVIAKRLKNQHNTEIATLKPPLNSNIATLKHKEKDKEKIKKIEDNNTEKIIAIVKNTKANTKALDIATQKHSQKHSQKQGKSIVGIDIQYTNIQYTNIQCIVDYLNLILKSSYKATTKKTKEIISARLKENFTIEDFKTVIDFKYKQWGSDDTMKNYLRPETLFGTKFESYLQSAKMNITPKIEFVS